MRDPHSCPLELDGQESPGGERHKRLVKTENKQSLTEAEIGDQIGVVKLLVISIYGSLPSFSVMY